MGRNNGRRSAPKERAKQTSIRVKEPMELMTFLGFHFNGKSRTALKSMLAKQQVCVNGDVVTQFNHMLKPGDQVTLNMGRVNYELRSNKLKLLFEDQDIVVIDKVAGLPSVALSEGRKETTAFSIVSTYLKKKDPRNRLFVVHRIDKEMSGLLVFAKSKEVQLALQDSWHRVVTERVYMAVVEGVPEQEEDTIVSYEAASKASQIHAQHTGEAVGAEGIMHYRVTRKSDDYAMLRIMLEAGQKNQIRAQLQEMGHPIIGDRKFGADFSPIKRIGLHFRIMAFEHPVTRELLRFETAIPKPFSSLFIKRKEKNIDIEEELD